MPPEMLATLPGYGPDVDKNRAEARAIMEKLGYGPQQAARASRSRRATSPIYRDPAVILIDQLKEIYIDGELEVVETGGLVRQDRAQGLHHRAQPHRQRRRRSRPEFLRELLPAARSATTRSIATRSSRRCSTSSRTETDIDEAQEAGLGDRQEAAGGRGAADHLSIRARRPAGSRTSRTITVMVNSSYNGYRFEDVWLDR